MKRDELKALVRTEIEAAFGATSGDISKEIAAGLDRYYGEPLGNEEDGQSKVVATTTRDAIGWQMPSLMRIFTSTDKAVVFDPVDPNDEKAAEQETDIVNHVFYKENDGYLILHDSLKDGLLSKNAIAKVWWDDTPDLEREEYEGLSDIELQTLLMDDVDPIEHTQNGEFHDITVQRMKSRGSARIEVLPIEEFLISKDATSICPSKARFTCHKTRKTRSDLIQMGFSKKKVNALAAWHGQDDTEVGIARHNKDDEWNIDDAAHESMREIEVHECYYRVDFDGDGIAELRQITLAGNEVLVNEAVDRVPFVSWTPNMLPHKFFGMSTADETIELDEINTALLRGVLNNTYQANTGRTAVQEGMVNLDDLVTNRPNGVVRTLGPPGQTIVPLPYNPLPQQTFQVMEMMDQVRKERTGVSQETMGLEANVLAHGRTGVINQSFDASQMKLELIARNYAEVFLKTLFLELHGILQKHQDKAKWIKLRGEWIEVDPSEWKTRRNMTVTVGLGTGNKDKQLAGIGQIMAAQKTMAESGYRGVQDANIHNAATKLVEFAGLKNAEMYFTDTSTLPPPEPQPDPQMELAKAQLQLTQAQIQVANTEAETNRQEAIWRHQEKMKELADKDTRERIKLELEYNRDVSRAI
jgi:hypothetical protein